MPSVWAAGGHEDHEGHGSGAAAEDKDKGKGEGGGHGGSGGHGGGGMMHKTMAMPGSVQPQCHAMGGMPPHYCEPAYKVMSSVPGVQIAEVSPAGERVLQLTLKELNEQFPGVAQKLVVVGGASDLAGAVVIAPGWKQTTKVQLNLNGTQSIYSQPHLHLHVFPLTSN
jgi:hypothetical protein